MLRAYKIFPPLPASVARSVHAEESEVRIRQSLSFRHSSQLHRNNSTRKVASHTHTPRETQKREMRRSIRRKELCRFPLGKSIVIVENNLLSFLGWIP